MLEKIKKLKNNKLALGIMSLVAGLVVALLSINLKTSNFEVKNVVVTTKNVEVGDKITEEMITTKKISGDTSGLISNKEEVIGKYAKVEMVTNDYITNNKLSTEAIYGSAYLENLGKDDRAISVSITSNAKGLSGKLESGDIISVILSEENNDGLKNTYIPEELKYVEIISVSDSSGLDVGTSEEAKNIGSTVTLLVREEQSLVLANAEDLKDIHFQLVYRGNDEYKQKLLEEQKSIIIGEVIENTEILSQSTTISEENTEVISTKNKQ